MLLLPIYACATYVPLSAVVVVVVVFFFLIELDGYTYALPVCPFFPSLAVPFLSHPSLSLAVPFSALARLLFPSSTWCRLKNKRK